MVLSWIAYLTANAVRPSANSVAIHASRASALTKPTGNATPSKPAGAATRDWKGA